MALRVFGLTGGIGSGKSTVAGIWRAQGLPVIDADVLAREAVAQGTATQAAIVAHFGSEMLQADGSLDRARLAERVFGDAEATRALGAIVHPEVRRLAQQRFSALEQQGHTLACYEVPLLFETGIEQGLKPIVVVNAAPATQLERAMARDNVSATAITRRMQAQLPLSEKVARADFVIENMGTLQDLGAAARATLAQICRRVACDPKIYGLE